MLCLINFLLTFFWFAFFIFCSNNIDNFFKVIIYSESVWIIIYVLDVLLSSWFNDINLLSLSLFIIGFAAIELSIGLLLMIYFNKINKSIFFKLDKTNNNFFL